MEMLLARGQILHNSSERLSLATDCHEISWHGFVYREGSLAGAESIRKFADELRGGLAEAAAKLKGVYFIAVRDIESHRCYAFVDNSSLYHAYYSTRFAGTSFLEIATAENLRTADLNPEAVVDLLHFGCVYSGKTLFDSIRKIDGDTIVSIGNDGRVELLSKPLPDIATPCERSFGELLKELSVSAETERLSLDLTGGIDSRLLAVVFSYFGMPFELAGSGMPGNQDLRIAETVAKILGREFYATHHNPNRTDWEDIFESCDGLFDLAKADRPLQLQQDRVRRGITLAISGAGGELFKDFWWLQDFPFYVLRKPRLGRLYATRISPAGLKHSLFTGKYRTASETYRERLLNTLSSYVVPGNTQTYDRIYYAFKMREFAGRFLTNSVKLIQVHTPYLDREAVRIGYGMKRRERFFDCYHRRLITRLSPAAARVSTTEGGMTVSWQPVSISIDLLKYVVDRSTRIMRKLGQRVCRKTYWQESADHPQLVPLLRQSIAARKAIDRLKDCGILNPSIQSSEVESSRVGSVLALDMFIAGLESKVWFTPVSQRRTLTAA